MNNVAPVKFGMGAPVRRKEDKALITGAGRFVDDYTPVGTLRAYVLRATMAHARIKLGDLTAAKEVPGVRLVMTGTDVGDPENPFNSMRLFMEHVAPRLAKLDPDVPA